MQPTVYMRQFSSSSENIKIRISKGDRIMDKTIITTGLCAFSMTAERAQSQENGSEHHLL